MGMKTNPFFTDKERAVRADIYSGVCGSGKLLLAAIAMDDDVAALIPGEGIGKPSAFDLDLSDLGYVYCDERLMKMTRYARPIAAPEHRRTPS